MTSTIFPNWKTEHSSLYGKQPLCIAHELHKAPLFSREALAELIDAYPREHYSLIHMGEQSPDPRDIERGAKSAKRFWREGELGGLRGEQVIDAIEAGRMWLNLRAVNLVDARYRDLIAEIYAQLGDLALEDDTFGHMGGILISSPRAQVYYHCDLSGQSLFQISGTKRVYIYPNTPPFLTPEQLEHIALYAVEVDMPYSASYDEHATIFDLQPGEMLHWPLNGPHRVENADCLNVSLTTEYWTQDIRRKHMMNMANGLLREKFGLKPEKRQTQGPVFWAKAALQAGARRSGWLDRKRAERRPIEFRLDPDRPGHVIDLKDASNQMHIAAE